MNNEQTYPATQLVGDIDRPAERLRLSHDLVKYLRAYAADRPEVVALWCLGIGFVLGWKLKPW